MKKFFGVLVGVLFAMTMTGQAGAASRGDLLTDKQRAQGLQGDLGPYKQIFPYIPIDAKRVPERQGVCDKKFNEVTAGSDTAGRCFRYYSKKEGTMWTIRSDDSTALPERIGRWENNKPVLWATFLATFDPSEKNGVIYASPEAQKYASTYDARIGIALSAQGVTRTEAAQSPPTTYKNWGQRMDEQCAIASNTKSDSTIAQCRIYRPGSPGSENNHEAGSPGGDDTSAPSPSAESQVEDVVKKGISDLFKGFGR